MVRKLALSLAIAAAMTAGQANALGLGEIRVNSALNEPLNADIRLVQVRDLSPMQIMPRMADIDEFSLAGMTKSRFLNDLKFQVKVEPDGSGSIHVTSSFPVQEPFLSFLMEVNWPNGRLVREYTLLLDPPVFDPAPVTTSINAPAAAPAVIQATAPQASASPSGNIRSEMSGGEVFVNNNDTLYVLAKNNRPSSDISIEQMMVAMQRKNPDLFPTANINVMRAGKVMRIPTADEARVLTRRQAIAEAARQTADWKASRRAASSPPAVLPKPATDTVSGSSGSAEGAPNAEQSQLKIVTLDKAPAGTENVSGDAASEADEASSTVEAPPSVKEVELIQRNEELEDRIMMTQESVDKVSRENAELGDKLDSIQEQLLAMQRLIELKDQQMASLQAEMLKQAQEANKPKSSSVDAFINMLMENPLYLGGLGGLLVLLLALFALARRRKAIDYDDEPAPRKSKKAKKAKPTPVEEDEIPDFDEPVKEPANVAPQVAAVAGAAVAASAISAREPIDNIDDGLDDELADLDLDMDLDLNEGDDYVAEVDESLRAIDEPVVASEADEIDSVLDDILNDDSGLDDVDDLDALLDQDMDVEEDLSELVRAEDEVIEDDELDGLEFAIAEPDDEKEDSNQDSMIDDSFFDEEIEPESDQVMSTPDTDESDLMDEVLESDDSTQMTGLDSVKTDEDLDDLLDDDLDRMLAQSAADLAEKDHTEPADEKTVDDELDFNVDKMLDEVDDSGAENSSDDGALDFDLDLLDDDATPSKEVVSEEIVSKELSSEASPDAVTEDPLASDALASNNLADELDLIDEAAQLPSNETEVSGALEEDSAELDDLLKGDMDLDEMVSELDEAAAIEEPDRPKKPGELVEDELTANIAHDLDMSLDDEIEEMLAFDEDDIELIEENDDESIGSSEPFDILDGADESETKLDLARAYIEMDDTDGARDILAEVVRDGSAQQQAEAQSLLDKMS